VTHDNTSEPVLLPPAELFDLLRRLADTTTPPDTVQADARDYLQHLQAASSDSGLLTGGPLDHGRHHRPATAAQQGREAQTRSAHRNRRAIRSGETSSTS